MPEDQELSPYNKKVLDHFLNPRNMGEITDADAVGSVGSPACGDVMKVWLKIRDGRIVDAHFKTFGCGAAIASSSVATEMVKGRTIEEALKLSNREVVDQLGGLPAYKMHCSVLAEDAIKSALNDYFKKHPEVAQSLGVQVTATEAVPTKEPNH